MYSFDFYIIIFIVPEPETTEFPVEPGPDTSEETCEANHECCCNDTIPDYCSCSCAAGDCDDDYGHIILD